MVVFMEQKFQIENDNGTINVNFIGIPLKEDIDIEENKNMIAILDRINNKAKNKTYIKTK